MKVSARTAEATHVESLRKSPKCKKRCRRRPSAASRCAPVLFGSAQVHFALSLLSLAIASLNVHLFRVFSPFSAQSTLFQDSPYEESDNASAKHPQENYKRRCVEFPQLWRNAELSSARRPE